jgi:hypothetical protein
MDSPPWPKERQSGPGALVERGGEAGPTKAIRLIMKDALPDDYVIAAGDNLFSLDLVKMTGFLKKVRSPVVALYNVSSKELARNTHASQSMAPPRSSDSRRSRVPEVPPCLHRDLCNAWAASQGLRSTSPRETRRTPWQVHRMASRTEGAYGYRSRDTGTT